MDKYRKLNNHIAKTYNRIRKYRINLFYERSAYRRMQYESLIIYEIDKILREMEAYNRSLKNQNTNPNSSSSNPEEENERIFTLEELAEYDGARGKPAYVAVEGVVYDVSREATWGGGSHFGLLAGRDLTKEFKDCHGSEGILKGLPKVGVLKK